jgi:hypothetical protein
MSAATMDRDYDDARAEAHRDAEIDAMREREDAEAARAEDWLLRHDPQPERHAEMLYPVGDDDDDSPF